MAITTLKLTTLFLVVATLVTSAAHTLEAPGKLRLSREHYLAVQHICYPGFTIAGAAEPLAILALFALLLFAPGETRQFWLIAGALGASTATHLLYWLLTAPVNKVWLADEAMATGAKGFFAAAADAGSADWRVLRDRWERSHIYRSVTALLSFLALALALLN